MILVIATLPKWHFENMEIFVFFRGLNGLSTFNNLLNVCKLAVFIVYADDVNIIVTVLSVQTYRYRPFGALSLCRILHYLNLRID